MFESFAQVYDRLSIDDYPTNQWVCYFEEICNQYKVKPETVIDLACGTGETVIKLKRHGYNVCGIDASIDMLDIAREKARKEGLITPFLCQDMREFEVHKPVDAITCFCDGVNYLEEIQDVMEMLTACHAQLKPGGLLLFDLSSEYKLQYKLNNQVFSENEEDLVFIWTNIYDKEEKTCQMDLTWFVKKENGDYKRYDETHFQYAYNTKDIQDLMIKVGFGQINCYDNFSLNPVNEKSERIFYTGIAE